MPGERWPLPTGWKWRRAADIADIVGGGTPPANDNSNFDSPGIPWVTPADLTGYSGTYISHGRRGLSEKGLASCGARVLPQGSILYSSRAPIGYCAIAANPISTNQGFKCLVLKHGILPQYVRYYLLASKDYAESLASGTTFKELSGSRMAEMLIPLAPLEEQQRIVAKLNKLGAHSQTARQEVVRIPQLVQRHKRAILTSAFRGDLTRDWRQLEASNNGSLAIDLEPLLPADLQGVGRRNIKAASPSWTPSIDLPDTWEIASVDQLATLVQYGTSAKTSDSLGDGVPVLRMGNIIDGHLGYTNLKYLPPSHDDFPNLLLQDGDVLFNRTNSAELVGKSAVFFETGTPTSFASYLIRLRLDGYLPELLSAYINSDFGRQWVRSVVSQQVGQANVNGTKLRQLGVPVMPMEEQAELLARIKKLLGAMDCVAAEVARATNLLDRLDQAALTKAFRGELVA